MIPFFVTSIASSAGDLLQLGRRSKVVFVGPNNVGKSTILREIYDALLGARPDRRVLSDVSVHIDIADAEQWLRAHTSVLVMAAHEHFASPLTPPIRLEYVRRAIAKQSTDKTSVLSEFGKLFVHYLQVDGRAGLVSRPERLEPDQPMNHPIQVFQNDEAALERLSRMSIEAFNMPLVLNHGGRDLRLHFGAPPPKLPGQDRVSPDFVRKLNALPEVAAQGHGVRSFVGLLVNLIVTAHDVILLDEPEVHLHPPQQRLLGRLMPTTVSDRQFFVSTHSATFLRGFLDGFKPPVDRDGDSSPDTSLPTAPALSDVVVVRVTRRSNTNNFHIINPADVKALWDDPLLRHSNILDGLFHDGVVVCEADSDCRFYSAVLDSIYSEHEKRPDILFVHCGGKDRIKVAVRALRAVGVPTVAIADIDILQDRNKLAELAQLMGSSWTRDQEAHWNVLNSAVSQKYATIQSRGVREEIADLLKPLKDSAPFPFDVAERIQRLLPKRSPWSTLKLSGRSGVPGGEPVQSFDKLVDSLKSIGLFVVVPGEAERFVSSIGGHGPEWASAVLEQKDFASDPELEVAKQFMRTVLAELKNPGRTV